MSESIASYPLFMQRSVILRRLKNGAGGLGTLSAIRAAEIMAGRHIKRENKTVEFNKTGVSIGGVQYQSIASYYEQNSI